jgi:glycosyltransferase involved in cell wall biosynthesis
MEQARRALRVNSNSQSFPEREVVQTDDGTVPRAFDVRVCSAREAGLVRSQSEFEELRAALAAREYELAQIQAWAAQLDSELVRMTSSRSYRLIRLLTSARRPLATCRRGAAVLAPFLLRLGVVVWDFEHVVASEVKRAARVSFRRGSIFAGRLIQNARTHVARAEPDTAPAASDPSTNRAPLRPGHVSIVLPVYNQAALLPVAVESILAQSYGDFELIIVNDGSTDGVERILAHYLDHPKIRILTQRNQRLAGALSSGFVFAQGEFWTWASSDNVMHPDQLARLVAFLSENPDAHMVYADYIAIDDRGQPLTDPGFRPQNRGEPASPEVHLPRTTRELDVLPDNFIGPCFLYRGWVGRLIGAYNAVQGTEDYDYWLRMSAGFKIAHLGHDEILHGCRVNDDSLSSELKGKPIVDMTNALVARHQRRAAYAAVPWHMLTDQATAARLATDGSAREFAAEKQSGDAVLPLAVQTSCLEAENRVDSMQKRLYLVDPLSLPAIKLERGGLPIVVGAWFDSAESVYEHRTDVARLADFAIAADAAVAERLELLGIETFLAGDPALVPELAINCANNRAGQGLFDGVIRPPRSLPRPFPRPGKPRTLLLQVDDFSQGGLENVVLSLALGLRAFGFSVSLLVLGSSGAAARRARQLGIDVRRLPTWNRGHHYRTLLKELQVELISAHYSTYGCAIAAEEGIPLVQVIHNSYVWLGRRQIAEFRAADHLTTAYVAVSPEVACYSDLALELSVDKMVVIPNGVESETIQAARLGIPGFLRQELGIEPDDFVYLNVASIHPAKAQLHLVRAMKDVADREGRARLVLAGPVVDPEYAQRVQADVGSLELESHVIFTGQRGDIGRFYWMADAFVLPSFWEGWSLALSEAVMTGLPVVATDVGAARDLISEVGGYLLKPPHGSVLNLYGKTARKLLEEDHPEFVAALARHMHAAREERSRHDVPAHFKQSLSQRRSIECHANLYHWLLQGASPQAARAWSRRPGVRRGLEQADVE